MDAQIASDSLLRYGGEVLEFTPNAAPQRLAALSPLEYDRCRQKEAEALGVRVITLDAEVERARKQRETGQRQAAIFTAPEPWPEAVDGASLLTECAGTINRYVALPEGAADVAALWIAHAHCFNACQHTPRLNITAPEKGCGKTLFLDVLHVLAPKAIRTENITTAVLFRIVDRETPTLLIDEYDSFLTENEELRGALNAGHKRGGCIMRCEGDNNEVKIFKTFAPVALAGIRSLPGTLADRSIIIRMQRIAPGEKRQPFDSRRVEHETAALFRKLARFALDNLSTLENCDPKLPEGAVNRIADNWRPLFAIAEVAGGEWPERVRRAYELLAKPDDDAESLGVLLLADMRALFHERGDRLLSADVVDALGKKEERPWPELRNGRPITARQLAALLKRFGIRPTILRAGDDRGKGYVLDDFRDVCARYLPETGGFDPCIRNNISGARVSGQLRSVTAEDTVTDRKPPETAPDMDCHGCTDRKPLAWWVRL